MTPRHARSILDLIGNTPVLSLDRVRAQLGVDGRLLAKLEHLNPGGSKKDRVALSMIRAARADGRLAPGQAVVEVTSGNTGTGLAIVCAALGHPFFAVMSDGNTRERAQMMRAFGAEVVLVPQVPGSTPGQVNGCDMRAVKHRAAELVAGLGAFFVDQFENPANPAAHEGATAAELWDQCGGDLDAVVAFVGSGGALGGLVRGLRARKPDLRAYVVEPAAASSLASGCCSDAGHAIQGGGYGRGALTLLGDLRIDGHLTCADATAAARLLARAEGVLAGSPRPSACPVAGPQLPGPADDRCPAEALDRGVRPARPGRRGQGLRPPGRLHVRPPRLGPGRIRPVPRHDPLPDPEQHVREVVPGHRRLTAGGRPDRRPAARPVPGTAGPSVVSRGRRRSARRRT